MEHRELTHDPAGKSEMLIRRPAAEVFEAFVNPAITNQFWFTKGSGRLEAGADIRWDWEMYDFSLQVRVRAIEWERRILIEWSVAGASSSGASSTVEFLFTPREDGTTFVSVTESGFRGDA